MTPADLLEPKGPLQVGMFPDTDANALLTGWISHAEGLVVAAGLTGDAAERATREYALYRAHAWRHQHAVDRPITHNEGGIVSTYTTDQLIALANAARKHRHAFSRLLAGLEPLQPRRGSRSATSERVF